MNSFRLMYKRILSGQKKLLLSGWIIAEGRIILNQIAVLIQPNRIFYPRFRVETKAFAVKTQVPVLCTHVPSKSGMNFPPIASLGRSNRNNATKV